MNCSWEDLTLGQHSESVGEGSNVVLWSLIVSLDWFVALLAVKTRNAKDTLRGTVGSYFATE